ncbi:hypothetical protein [Methanobacterium aggregans]
MKISRTITLDFEDLVKIDDEIKRGEFGSVSEFVQHAVKNELRKEGLNE